MIKIIIDSLELEKIKYQVTEKIMSDIKAVNYYIDDIFILGLDWMKIILLNLLHILIMTVKFKKY